MEGQNVEAIWMLGIVAFMVVLGLISIVGVIKKNRSLSGDNRTER